MKADTTKAARPAPPDDIADEALLEWGRICDELAALGQLDKTDRAVLTLYVETWATHRAAVRGVNKHGAVIRYPNKTTGPSPFYKVMKETAVILRGLLSDLKLNPATRAAAGVESLDDLRF